MIKFEEMVTCGWEATISGIYNPIKKIALMESLVKEYKDE